MPEHLVADDIAAGRLVMLGAPPRGGLVHTLTYSAFHRRDTQPGPAGRWFIERLAHWGASADAAQPVAPEASARNGTT